MLLASIIAFIGSTYAQSNKPYWEQTAEPVTRNASERTIIPEKYKTFHLSETDFKRLLFSAPTENSTHLRNSSLVIELPLPNGKVQKFRVVEAPIMPSALAAKHAEIKTFNVEGVDDPYANGKLDWTLFGFHGMINTPTGDFFIDPYSRNLTDTYISYYVADFKKDAESRMKEFGVRNSIKQTKKKSYDKTLETTLCAGTELRKYRLALACTGEYAQAATGKTAPTQAEILSVVTTSINRVDGIYETELAIRMVFIANEDTLLYGNPATDPFKGNNDADTLIEESQKIITDIIGSTNFDIGHTFSTGGGGLADLGCVCDSAMKASGITGNTKPVGDPYDVDYVAHEIGHQFGGNHTFTAATGACGGNANPDTRVEPGSGITIMAYAGICYENDIAPHSIAYFHTINFDEMMKFSIINNGNSCAVTSTTANQPPTVTIQNSSFTIPFSTPFTLTGTATDPDQDSLTYSWEEVDNGPQGDWNGGSKPFFRSYPPSTSASRTFPSPSIVLKGQASYQTTIGEYLPADEQTLNFRLTARDNKMGGGGVCYASSTVTIANAGPFAVTYPNTTGVTWVGKDSQQVRWDVNKTDTMPVNCYRVNILLSTDGGNLFTPLISNIPNSGVQNITVPVFPATQKNCRIKVESSNNIFFDVNDNDFTITVPDGINEYSVKQSIYMQLQPNPVTDELQINLLGINKSLKTQLRIMDILGNVILNEAFRGQEQINQHYNLSFLSKGVYIIDVQNTQQQTISRLVKQ